MGAVHWLAESLGVNPSEGVGQDGGGETTREGEPPKAVVGRTTWGRANEERVVVVGVGGEGEGGRVVAPDA